MEAQEHELITTLRSAGQVAYKTALWFALQAIWMIKNGEDGVKNWLEGEQAQALGQYFRHQIHGLVVYVLARLAIWQKSFTTHFSSIQNEYPQLRVAVKGANTVAVRAIAVLLKAFHVAVDGLVLAVTSERVVGARDEGIARARTLLHQMVHPDTAAMFTDAVRHAYEHRFTAITGVVVGLVLLLGPRKGLRVASTPLLFPVTLLFALLLSVWRSLLWLLGFRSEGIKKGSPAARYQSRAYGGNTPGKGSFAQGQKVGAGAGGRRK